MATLPIVFNKEILLLLPSESWNSKIVTPTTPIKQRSKTLTLDWFGLFPFRSPLLRESSFLSFPQVTEMFHFTCLPSLLL